MTNHSLLTTLLAAAALLGACSDASTTAPASDQAAAPGSPAAPPQAASAAPNDARIVVPGGTFTLPDGWARETPSSQMRLAQALIPGPGGPGELAVFYFGPGGGGGVEANLERWAGQVQTAAEPVRDSFTLGSWRVTWIDAAGTLMPSTMGSGPSEPQPDSRLFGAVVEGEGGPWFFKATGPDATLDAQREAFVNLLKSGRPSS